MAVLSSLTSLQLVLVLLAGAATAAPRPDVRHVEITNGRHDFTTKGLFEYAFETPSGIVVRAEGYPGSEGQVNIRGHYRCVFNPFY